MLWIKFIFDLHIFMCFFKFSQKTTTMSSVPQWTVRGIKEGFCKYNEQGLAQSVADAYTIIFFIIKNKYYTRFQLWLTFIIADES